MNEKEESEKGKEEKKVKEKVVKKYDNWRSWWWE